MRERWRALLLLAGTAWRTDPWRSAGLLLELIGRLRLPLVAWFLGVMADGVLQRDARLLSLGAAGTAATAVAWFAGMWTGSMIRLRLAEAVGFALDHEIATLIAELPGVEHHERPDVQDRLELLRQGRGHLGNSLNALVNTANAVVVGAGTLVALALASPWLLLLVPFALPALPIAAGHQRRLRAAEARFAEPARRARHLFELAVERDAGMELRVWGLQREIRGRFRQAWRESRGLLLAAERRSALLDTVGDLLFLAGFTGAVAFMLWRAARGQATVGQVVMAVYLARQVRTGVVEPIRSVSTLGETLRAATRLLWLRDYAADERRQRSGHAAPPKCLRDGIVFDRVSFRYPGTERWVLRDVSFRLPAGAVVALVGENGAGKSTLVKLLCRMYEPTAGRILVDGVELGQIEIGAWRARLSAAFQDYARPEFPACHAVGIGDLARLDDHPAVAAAMERAGAAGFLDTLPRGADTQLGARWPGGVDLSGGEWQKLALARALMRDEPLVLFFDEPTASLDALAEHALFERQARAARSGSMRGAVTVLVSHRFSTVRAADLILVVDGAGITELGAHDELMRRDGLYAELYQLQARSYG